MRKGNVSTKAAQMQPRYSLREYVVFIRFSNTSNIEKGYVLVFVIQKHRYK